MSTWEDRNSRGAFHREAVRAKNDIRRKQTLQPIALGFLASTSYKKSIHAVRTPQSVVVWNLCRLTQQCKHGELHRINPHNPAPSPSHLKLYLPTHFMNLKTIFLLVVPSPPSPVSVLWSDRDLSACFLLLRNNSRLPHWNPGGWQVLLLAEQMGNPSTWRKSALPELIQLIPLFLPPLPRNLSFSAPFWLFLDVLCGVSWSQSVHYQALEVSAIS